MEKIKSAEAKKAVEDMKSEALRFISKLEELSELQNNDVEYFGTYQFKERSAVARASIDLKRCMTKNIKTVYGWR